MALSAQLLFEKEESFYNILKCDFDFLQETVNAKGKEEYYPTENASGGYIDVTLLSPSDGKSAFHEWMFDPDTKRNGGLFFDIMLDGKQQHRVVVFQNARCISLEEKFESQTQDQMIIIIRFSAEHVHFGKNTDFFQRFVKKEDQEKLKENIDEKKEKLKDKLKEIIALRLKNLA